ncbi:MAG TPA: protein phosphatase 2C domain-containing protein [Candidatus Sumerlaeota bacterium]|nr:protein phosphatase 2C domain-containing protein [Candidatus Sumerlaeota bacterium]HOR26976.1 protein phosphatase 2C domain-containing protein [Candidatus Sumerlaeota bacterium]HPK02205.1 protein phosphatase 2C domain-containing protein [Candidatus Sumerlaeota bacterium]
MQFEHFALTHTGLVREMNQDSILALPRCGVFMVADGMGGEKAGDEASAQVVKTTQAAVEAFFKSKPTGPSQIENMLRDTLLEANHEVFQISVREPAKRGLGSTASLLCLHRGVYFVAQVGDSRVYRLRDGAAVQLTHDHTLVWLLYEQGNITRDQLETHPERHLLTQCIGSQKPVKVDVFEGDLQVGDTFLICSDGLTGYAREEKVLEILGETEISLEQRAGMMVDAALEAGGGDNVSVILVKITQLDAEDNWEPEATAPPTEFTEDTVDMLIDDEMRPQARPRRRRAGLLWGALVAVLAAGALFFLLPREAVGPNAIAVYLEPAEGVALPAGAVTATIVSTAADTTASQTLQTEDDAAPSFTVPGPGEYQVTLQSAGYAPLTLPLTVPAAEPAVERVSLPIAEWTRYGTYTLDYGDPSQLSRVRLFRADANGRVPFDRAAELTVTPDQLAGQSRLSFDLLPGEIYLVQVDVAGRRPITHEKISVDSGETVVYELNLPPPLRADNPTTGGSQP